MGKKAVPQLDAIDHQALRAWMSEATQEEIWQAIRDGEDLLDGFMPEMEDDATLEVAVSERLEMLNEEYSARLQKPESDDPLKGLEHFPG